MVEITIYEAVDGTRFNSKGDCEHYESVIDKANNIMSRLRPNDEISSNVAIRHDFNVVTEVKKDFFLLCAEVIPSYNQWFSEVANGIRHISHAGRVLSDYSHDFPVLWKLYFRLECINDFSGVEYEQPYFANHECEFKGVIK